MQLLGIIYLARVSKLSPTNISAPLYRAGLYREIRDGDPSWATYEIQPDESLLPELTTERVYPGLGADLKWVVLIAAGVDFARMAMPVGETIALPPVAWLRQRIRHYMDVEYKASMIPA